MLESVLIANRGEIACRIITTCRRLGVRSIALYSEADREARHVRLADEALAVGPAPAAESYLVAGHILDAARRSGAAAIHPGYGFLSESAAFARAVREAGLIFVGPSPEAMELMGGKDTAKAAMERAGVPLVPGYHGADQDDTVLLREARRIGFPLLIKAAAGGGGKGMRRVDQEPHFLEALAACRREARAAFGDDRVLLEQLVVRPRHVEVQVFGDRHGQAVHLFERDCTLQRRHQKVVEEAPAPSLPAGTREAIGRAAVQAALAAAYENAGTVEFLLAPDGGFYFIEMNTRLQVEHPVTELVTGLDLVEWQLRIAAGQPLPLTQEQIGCAGHAVEVRLYAEDPARGFLPSTGRLARLRLPENLPGIRVDTGVVQGDMVTPFYDPMIAKIIAHGPDRARTLDLLGRALDAAEVAGPETNLTFLRRLIRADALHAMEIDTGWLDRELGALIEPSASTAEDLALAAVALHLEEQGAAAAAASRSPEPGSPWHRADGWALNRGRARTYRLRSGEETVIVLLKEDQVETMGRTFRLGPIRRAGGSCQAELDGRMLGFAAAVYRDRVILARRGTTHTFLLADAFTEALEEEGAERLLTAPMPGKVTRLLALVGDHVRRGQPLAILEAMKMEHQFEAPRDGTIAAVHVSEGEQVEEGTILLDLSAGEAET